MTIDLLCSPDSTACVVRFGRQLAMYSLTQKSIDDATLTELPDDSSDLALLGSPTMAISATRAESSTIVQLLQPPTLEVVAELALAGRWSIATVVGSRAALLSDDARSCTVVRAAGRSLVAKVLDPGGLVDHVIALEPHQLAIATTKKLELWDVVAARPLTRLQLTLPPPPRRLGTAAGHWWIVQPGIHRISILRLSDGRPFVHEIGAVIRSVTSHPASPWLVIDTDRGLLRLSCYAHALMAIEVAPADRYAIAQAGDDAMLLGVSELDQSPWRFLLSAPASGAAPALRPEIPSTMAGAVPVPPAASAPLVPGTAADAATAKAPSSPSPSAWRSTLARFGAQLSGGGATSVPEMSTATELSTMAERLRLADHARQVLLVLYAAWLGGVPRVAMTRLTALLGDACWSEVLGVGLLGQLGLLRHRDGAVALRRSVVAALDGRPWQAIRLAGEGPSSPDLPQMARIAVAVWPRWLPRLGKVALVTGGLRRAILEARLAEVPAVVFEPPQRIPSPWPAGARLLVVTDSSAGMAGQLPDLSAAEPTVDPA